MWGQVWDGMLHQTGALAFGRAQGQEWEQELGQEWDQEVDLAGTRWWSWGGPQKGRQRGGRTCNRRRD